MMGGAAPAAPQTKAGGMGNDDDDLLAGLAPPIARKAGAADPLAATLPARPGGGGVGPGGGALLGGPGGLLGRALAQGIPLGAPSGGGSPGSGGGSGVQVGGATFPQRAGPGGMGAGSAGGPGGAAQPLDHLLSFMNEEAQMLALPLPSAGSQDEGGAASASGVDFTSARWWGRRR
jgi:hypothetical protein